MAKAVPGAGAVNLRKNISILVLTGLVVMRVSAVEADSPPVALDCGQIAKLLEYSKNDFAEIRVYPGYRREDVTDYGSSLSFQAADRCGISDSVITSQFDCGVNDIGLPDAMNRASQVTEAIRSCELIKPIDANESDHHYYFSYSSDRFINLNVIVREDSSSPQRADFSFWFGRMKPH
jgi:hypothetical protein